MEDSARLGASLAGPWWRLALLGFGLFLVAIGLWITHVKLEEATLAGESFNRSCTGSGYSSQITRCASLDAEQSTSRSLAASGAFVAGIGVAFAPIVVGASSTVRVPRIVLGLLGFVLVFAGLAMPIADARLAPMGVTARCTGTIHYGGIIVCPEPIPALPPDVWQGIAVIVLSGAMFAVGLWFLLASLPPRSREPSLPPQ